MPYEFSVYGLLIGSISIVALFLLLYPFISKQKSRVTIYFIAMVGSSLPWCVGYFFELSANDIPTMAFWNIIQFIGVCTLPPIFLLFVLVFTQRQEIISKPIVSLIFFPPMIHYLFLLTNDYHYLFYISVDVLSSNFGSSLVHTGGPLYYSNMIYAYILFAVGFFILIRTYITTSEANLPYKKQLLFLIFGTTIPFFGSVIQIFNLIPILKLDITPIVFLIVYTVFAYAIYEIGFLDIIPIARQRVFEEILDGFLVIDHNWRLIDLNIAARDILLPQLKLSDMYGKHIFKLLKENILQKAFHEKIDEIKLGLEGVREGKSSMYSTEFEVLIFEGYPRKFFDLLASPLKSPNNKDFLGFVIILRDITDRVIAKLTLQQKNQMQELILKLLSHDLYNHLNVSYAYADIAAAANDLEGTKEGLLAIKVKNRATMQLIDEVTSYLETEEHLRSKSLVKYDLKEGIQAAIKQLQPELEIKKILTTLTLHKNPAYILANLTMDSVLINLISNAIKFSPERGEIEICLKDHKNYWRISVADQGPGISEDLKDKVFEPFTSFGKNKGTGLGLSIAFQAIQHFLGRIWIENVNPHGAIFIIEIPKIVEN